MTTVVRVGDIVPFPCVYIDAELKEIFMAIQRCFATERLNSRSRSKEKLVNLFGNNGQHVLPCLSVRSAFDLFLLATRFESGSEVIMSAVNVPGMEAVARHHGLAVVPLDVDIETLEPKCGLLPELITERTVLILVAHIYGSTYDVAPFLRIARSRGILFVEDCAESFSGLDGYLGHPLSDASFHSFGIIKRRTCFGGAIAKITNHGFFRRMVEAQETFPLHMNSEYLEKLVQYVAIYFILNVPSFSRSIMRLGKWAKWDYQTMVVHWLRSYKGDFIAGIRRRPSTALMVTMAHRLGEEDTSIQVLADIKRASLKREIVNEMLPDDVVPVGRKATVKPNWLFPVLVKDSSNFSVILNRLGIDSYKGVTQLKAILPESPCHCRLSTTSGYASTPSSADDRAKSGLCAFPHDAAYMIDHVVYLPVQPNVPDNYLRMICEAARAAAKECSTVERRQRLTESKL